MPQGNMKKKVQLPKGVKQKQKTEKKGVLRKGSFTIAPKKAKLIEQKRLKKSLEKQLRANIEKKAISLSSDEPKRLEILKNTSEKSGKN